MSATCYVMGCKSGHEACQERVNFFRPNNEKTVILWNEFIGRKDVKLNTNHLVCQKHFQDTDVVKVFVKHHKPRSKTGQQVTDTLSLPQKYLHTVKLAVGAVPKLLTGKSMEMVETTGPLPRVKRTVHNLQPLLLTKISKENVINSKIALKRPILANKTVVHLVNRSASHTLQIVSPSYKKIANHSQPITINSKNTTNQQTPSVRLLRLRVDSNNTASELRKVSTTTQHYIVNPKDVTLPSSWFWQEGSLLDHEFICSKFKWLDKNKFEYTKTAIINGDTRTLRFFVRGQQVFHEKLNYQFSAENELIDCLALYDKIPECVGFSDRESLQISSSNVQKKSSKGETRSENCLLLCTTNGNSCRNCMKKNLKKNEPERPLNGLKICNIQLCQASSEPPVTHANLDENLHEPQILNFHLDHNYGLMTSPTSLDNRPIEISNRSENEENDKSDLELAKRFLKNETVRKKTLQQKLNRGFKMVKESKDMARKILKAWKKLQKKLSVKPKRPKKSSPLTPCNQCGRMIRAARMQLHLKIHGGFKPHNCELCARGFATKKSLSSHVRFNHLGVPKPFMCSVCGKTYEKKCELERHEMFHTNDKPFECYICDKKYRMKFDLKVHKRSHTGEKPYACKVCGKSYAHRHNFRRHFSRHHENKGPDGTIDPSIGYVWKKKSTSTALKRHSCTICNKSYTEKTTLKQHIKRYHEPAGLDGQKDPMTRARIRKVIPRYRCEFCQKEFCRVLAFEQHRSTHTGNPVAIPCGQPNCDFTYSILKQLKNHLVAHHPGKVFTCDVCGTQFLHEFNLNSHRALHNPSLGFQCSYCPQKTASMSGLMKHEKIHTRDTKETS